MPTDTDSEPNHYTELREVYKALIDDHREYNGRARNVDASGAVKTDLLAKRDATLDALVRVEDLLNEWVEHDERDGPPGRDE